MQQSLSILYCSTSDFKPRQGGIAEMTHQIAVHLALAGHRPHVVGFSAPGADDFDKTARYPVSRIRSDRKGRFEDLARLVDEQRPDLIIVNVLGSCLPECHRLAKKHNLPLVVFVYGTDVTMFKNPLAFAKVWISLSWADGIFSCSDATRSELPKIGIHKAHAYTMYTGIDPQYDTSFAQRPASLEALVPADKKVILTLCRLTERKGADHAIEATARLAAKRGDFVHIIAGSGTEGPALKRRVAELGLESVIRFAGEVDDALKHALYRRMDVYLMPNRRLSNGDVEGFGTTFLEANMYGKPVIGGNSGGTREAIEHGKSGYLVDAFAIDQTATYLEGLLDQPELAREMGAYGRQRALDKFSYSTLVTPFVQQLTKIQQESH